MALPFRTRAIPQCSACIRNYAWADAATAPATALRQQVRGKKKMPKPSGTIPVRLLKDLVGFGKRGSIIPVATGEMRNKFFPRRIAEYVTMPELKTLRATNVPIERDYTFGKEEPLVEGVPALEAPTLEIAPDVHAASMRSRQREVEPEKLSPDRSVQLLEIFVKPVLEFYRQPIIEEKEPEEPPKPEPKRERQRSASSAAADLLAARTSAPRAPPKPTGPQAIYGSVSTHDVLVHIRAAIATNDEAAKVQLHESDIRFLDKDAETEGRVKHTGDFTIEVTVKGAAERVKRTVRVIPQEA